EIPDKLREMKLAVAIEKDMTKDEILEGYLNIVLFSGRTYGVESAARLFFNKPAADLNISESALLAGLVQSPNALNPDTNPEGAMQRRDLVLGWYRDSVRWATESRYQPRTRSRRCIAPSG